MYFQDSCQIAARPEVYEPTIYIYILYFKTFATDSCKQKYVQGFPLLCFWSVWRHLLRHSPDSDSGVSTEWHPFQEYKCSGTRREAQGCQVLSWTHPTIASFFAGERLADLDLPISEQYIMRVLYLSSRFVQLPSCNSSPLRDLLDEESGAEMRRRK